MPPPTPSELGVVREPGRRVLPHRSPPGRPTATSRIEDGDASLDAGIPTLDAHGRVVRLRESVNPSSTAAARLQPARSAVHVLATVDENTYVEDGGMGDDHPVAWCSDYDGGRSWYTGGGHTRASFSEPLFRQHLLGGICGPPPTRAPSAAGTSRANDFRRSRSTATRPTRWRWTSRPTAACSSSSARAR